MPDVRLDTDFVRVMDRETGHRYSLPLRAVVPDLHDVLADAPATDAAGGPLPPEYKAGTRVTDQRVAVTDEKAASVARTGYLTVEGGGGSRGGKAKAGHLVPAEPPPDGTAVTVLPVPETVKEV